VRGASAALRRGLFAVDVTNCTLDARMLSAQELSPRGLLVHTAKAAAAMLRPYRDTLEKITTDDGNELTDGLSSFNRTKTRRLSPTSLCSRARRLLPLSPQIS
jgi:hypothetical protein